MDSMGFPGRKGHECAGDRINGNTFTCTAAMAQGSVTDQVSSTNTHIGVVSSSNFGDPTHKCSGPFGSRGTSIQKAKTLAWIDVLQFNEGVTLGDITDVDQVLTISSIAGTCTAESTGTAGFSYANATDLLQFIVADDDLRVASASGSCFAIIHANDLLTLTSGSGGLTITGSPVNPIQISQP